MTAAIQQHQAAPLAGLDADSMQALVTGGDCSRLSPAQRTAYYIARCEAAGLDPRAQPFAFTNLNGKLILYALKAASDQLAAKHKAKTQIVSQVTEDGVRVVTVRVETADGRVTEEIGALNVKGLQGEALANALMKAVTKAKRRAILSVCGLGALDETEVESIPGAVPANVVELPVASPAQVVQGPTVSPATGGEAGASLPKRATPRHVLVMWDRLVTDCGGDKAKAKAELARATAARWPDKVPAKAEWTETDCDELYHAIADVPF